MPQEGLSNGSLDSPSSVFFFFLALLRSLITAKLTTRDVRELQPSQAACDPTLLPPCCCPQRGTQDRRPGTRRRGGGSGVGVEEACGPPPPWGRSGTATSPGSSILGRNNGQHSVVILDVILLEILIYSHFFGLKGFWFRFLSLTNVFFFLDCPKNLFSFSSDHIEFNERQRFIFDQAVQPVQVCPVVAVCGVRAETSFPSCPSLPLFFSTQPFFFLLFFTQF